MKTITTLHLEDDDEWAEDVRSILTEIEESEGIKIETIWKKTEKEFREWWKDREKGTPKSVYFGSDGLLDHATPQP